MAREQKTRKRCNTCGRKDVYLVSVNRTPMSPSDARAMGIFAPKDASEGGVVQQGFSCHSCWDNWDESEWEEGMVSSSGGTSLITYSGNPDALCAYPELHIPGCTCAQDDS